MPATVGVGSLTLLFGQLFCALAVPGNAPIRSPAARPAQCTADRAFLCFGMIHSFLLTVQCAGLTFSLYQLRLYSVRQEGSRRHLRIVYRSNFIGNMAAAEKSFSPVEFPVFARRRRSPTGACRLSAGAGRFSAKTSCDTRSVPVRPRFWSNFDACLQFSLQNPSSPREAGKPTRSCGV